MSIFEGVTGGLLFQEANRLASAVVEQQGGLAALIAKFNEYGLGDIAQSWVSNGPNEPVTAEQLRTVLDTDSPARRFGLDGHDYAQALTRLLPEYIDRLTPDGVLPQDS